MCVATVTQSGSAVLDLCAATAYRAFIGGEGPGGNKEANLEYFRRKRRGRSCLLGRVWDRMRGRRKPVGPKSLLPQPLQDWIEQVRSSSDWRILKDLRDGYTHRIVRRDATVGFPFLESTWIAGMEEGGTDEPESHMDPPAIGRGALHVSGDRRIDPIDVGPRIHAYVESQLEAFVVALQSSLIG